MGLSIGEEQKAYPVHVLREERLVNDVVGGTEVVIVASSNSSAARVYEASGREFAVPEAGAPVGLPTSIVDGDGAAWQVTEEALVSADGSARLERLYSQISFWFGWFAFHPETLLYEGRIGGS